MDPSGYLDFMGGLGEALGQAGTGFGEAFGRFGLVVLAVGKFLLRASTDHLDLAFLIVALWLSYRLMKAGLRVHRPRTRSYRAEPATGKNYFRFVVPGALFLASGLVFFFGSNAASFAWVPDTLAVFAGFAAVAVGDRVYLGGHPFEPKAPEGDEAPAWAPVIRNGSAAVLVAAGLVVVLTGLSSIREGLDNYGLTHRTSGIQAVEAVGAQWAETPEAPVSVDLPASPESSL